MSNSYFHRFTRNIRKHKTCFELPILSSFSLFLVGRSCMQLSLGPFYYSFSVVPGIPRSLFILCLALKLDIHRACHSKNRFLVWPQNALLHKLSPWTALTASFQDLELDPGLSLLFWIRCLAKSWAYSTKSLLGFLLFYLCFFWSEILGSWDFMSVSFS